MIPFDKSVSVLAGQTLALSAKRSLADEPSLYVNRPLMVSLLWMTLLYAPRRCSSIMADRRGTRSNG